MEQRKKTFINYLHNLAPDIITNMLHYRLMIIGRITLLLWEIS